MCYDSIDFIDILATPCSKSVCLRALRAMVQYCFSMLLNQLPVDQLNQLPINQLPVEPQPLPLCAPPPVLSSIEWRIVCTALSLLEKFAADSHFKTFFASAIAQPMLLFLVPPPFQCRCDRQPCHALCGVQVCVVASMQPGDVQRILASSDDHSM